MSQDEDYDQDEDYEYNDYDDHDYEEKDDIEFVPEVAAYERVGGGGLKFIDIEINIEKGRKGRMALKAELAPDQLFLFDLQKSFNKYREYIVIGSGDIEIIKNIVPKINYISCKNPDAFLLAYYVLRSKKEGDIIDTTKLSQVKTLLRDVDEIRIEDIVRYSRLINRHM